MHLLHAQSSSIFSYHPYFLARKIIFHDFYIFIQNILIFFSSRCFIWDKNYDAVSKTSSSTSIFRVRPSGMFLSELIWIYGSYRRLIWFLGRGIGLIAKPLTTQGNTNTEAKPTDNHSWSWIRTHDPIVWVGEDILCLRRRGQRDRLCSYQRFGRKCRLHLQGRKENRTWENYSHMWK